MTRADDEEVSTFGLTSDVPFSYRCNACSRCCHHKIIQVSPYEIVRLARGLGLTTTEFIARHTTEGGTVLRRRAEDDGACVFLSPRGCGVHPDRPLVCRIYPLGAAVTADGATAYRRLEPDPETEGDYGLDGTIADYVARQGVPQARAGIAPYKRLYRRMAEILAALDAASLDHAEDGARALVAMTDGAVGSPLIDADATLAVYCAERGRVPPVSVEETVALHVAAIDEMLDAVAARHLSPPRPGA